VAKKNSPGLPGGIASSRSVYRSPGRADHRLARFTSQTYSRRARTRALPETPQLHLLRVAALEDEDHDEDENEAGACHKPDKKDLTGHWAFASLFQYLWV